MIETKSAARSRRAAAAAVGRIVHADSFSSTLVFVLFPLVWLALGSFKTRHDALSLPPRIIFEPTFEAYAKIVAGGFLRAFGNSLTIALTNVVAGARDRHAGCLCADPHARPNPGEPVLLGALDPHGAGLRGDPAALRAVQGRSACSTRASPWRWPI